MKQEVKQEPVKVRVESDDDDAGASGSIGVVNVPHRYPLDEQPRTPPKANS